MCVSYMTALESISNYALSYASCCFVLYRGSWWNRRALYAVSHPFTSDASTKYDTSCGLNNDALSLSQIFGQAFGSLA